MQNSIELTITHKNDGADNRRIQSDLRQYHATIKRNKMNQGEFQRFRVNLYNSPISLQVFWTRAGGQGRKIRRRIQCQDQVVDAWLGLLVSHGFVCLLACVLNQKSWFLCTLLTKPSEIWNTRETRRSIIMTAFIVYFVV